jgi:hypothetical protein
VAGEKHLPIGPIKIDMENNGPLILILRVSTLQVVFEEQVEPVNRRITVP